MRLYPFSMFGIVLFLLPAILFSQDQDVSMAISKGRLSGSFRMAEEGSKVLPTVVFVSGSGPTDRNGNQPMGGSNAIGQLADSLAQLGISSLRFDKRGIGESQLSDMSEEALLLDTFVYDLIAWIDYLSKEQSTDVILAGHSEGALIATLAAQRHSSVVGIITLAGAGRTADSLMIQQFQRQPAFVAVAADSLFRQLREGLPVQAPPFLQGLFRPSILPYLSSWIKFDPAAELGKLDMPVLVVSGDADLQVFAEDANRLNEAARQGDLLVFTQMNHVLKSVTSPADNMASYTDSHRPNYPGLAAAIYHWIFTKYSE